MIFIPDDFYRLGMALLVGAIIGAERERNKKAVGLRTLILISLGSALFTILSYRLSISNTFDPGRIAANIVSGIGFLGAGVILEERGRVTGLTTAATIWLTAALGMAAGAGEYILSAGSAIMALVVLLLFTRFEEYLEISTETRVYQITTKVSWEKYKQLKSLFKEYHLPIQNYKQEKNEDEMVCTFEVYGTTKRHDKLVQKLLNDKQIKELRF
ncbi:MAG: MgtC/SapB family protein [Anaerolineaceae bacterium]|nr:MgtC/SapB family protein [Anaerolineaceae bacterium]